MFCYFVSKLRILQVVLENFPRPSQRRNFRFFLRLETCSNIFKLDSDPSFSVENYRRESTHLGNTSVIKSHLLETIVTPVCAL